MANGNFLNNLSNYIGQTVTIFTTSGGESGRGFTGVLALVNPSFVRLITQIGPAPGCALGNCCERPWQDNVGGVQDDICADGLGGQGRANCRVTNLGSVVDIPVDRIASFVHNAVGGGW